MWEEKVESRMREPATQSSSNGVGQPEEQKIWLFSSSFPFLLSLLGAFLAAVAAHLRRHQMKQQRRQPGWLLLAWRPATRGAGPDSLAWKHGFRGSKQKNDFFFQSPT